MLWRLWLLVVPNQGTDQGTRSPIELFWTAKKYSCHQESQKLSFCMLLSWKIITSPLENVDHDHKIKIVMSVQGDFGDPGFSDVWKCNCDKDLCKSASKSTISLIFLRLCRLCISHSIKKCFNILIWEQNGVISSMGRRCALTWILMCNVLLCACFISSAAEVR